MDRDDARFVADALDSRISGDREALDRLAASEAVRLMAAAVRVKALAADWPPAYTAALELESIIRLGADAAAGDAHPNLQIFVDKLLELAGEAPRPSSNRFERRRAIAGRTALKARRAPSRGAAADPGGS